MGVIKLLLVWEIKITKFSSGIFLEGSQNLAPTKYTRMVFFHARTATGVLTLP